MRITLVIHGLTAGGAERVMSIIANYWAEHGQNVTLVSDEDPANEDFYKLDKSITRAYAYLPFDGQSSPKSPARALAIIKRIFLIRKQIIRSNPDVVISFIDEMNVRVLLALWGSKIPVIVSERIDPNKHPLVRPVLARLRPIMYQRAAVVTAQTERALKFFDEKKLKRGAIVPNPVILPKLFEGPNEDAVRNSKKVIAMGRFDQQKGFDLLIEAFSKIIGSRPDWSLEIWGDGHEREKYQKQIESLGMERHISLPGKTQQPAEKMRSSSIFVLSSRYEGFPNVLCEAMACGMPVIATDCDSGPADIVIDGQNGILIPSEDILALSSAMGRLMDDTDERVRLSRNSQEVIERFNIDRVMGIWEQLIRDVNKDL